MIKKLKIGYIGNGKSANRYHLPYVLIRNDRMEVRKIYARTLRKDTWARIPGIVYTDDMEEVLSDPEIDLVVVCTVHAPGVHYELAKKVLEHGKHCMVEKPFTDNVAQAEELYRMAEERGLLVQPYHNRRFDSDFLTALKVIESGKLGEVFEMELHYDYYRPEVPYGAVGYSRQDSMLYGHGCHSLDQAISYFGRPDRVHFDVRQLLGTGHMNDYLDLDLYYGSLKVCIGSSYFRIKARPSVVVYGQKGCFIKETKDQQEACLKKFYLPGQPGFGEDDPRDYGILTYYDDGGAYHEEAVVTEPGDYGRVYDDLYEAIIHGRRQTITREQVLAQMEILEKGVEGLI